MKPLGKLLNHALLSKACTYNQLRRCALARSGTGLSGRRRLAVSVTGANGGGAVFVTGFMVSDIKMGAEKSFEWTINNRPCRVLRAIVIHLGIYIEAEGFSKVG